MVSKRRAFLQMAGLAPGAAVAGLVASGAALSAPAAPRPLTRSAFEPCVGDEFSFDTGTFEQVRARLERVAPLPGAAAAKSEGQFALQFAVAPAQSLAQASYRVSHPRFGTFVMFVSPNDAEGRIVEAVFNRL